MIVLGVPKRDELEQLLAAVVDEHNLLSFVSNLVICNVEDRKARLRALGGLEEMQKRLLAAREQLERHAGEFRVNLKARVRLTLAQSALRAAARTFAAVPLTNGSAYVDAGAKLDAAARELCTAETEVRLVELAELKTAASSRSSQARRRRGGAR